LSGVSPESVPISRDFTVAVFVVAERRVLLHFHKKLQRWLPPGGHIERDELPDDAARREVLEETGVEIELVGENLNSISGDGQPVQLCRPAGIQVASIRPGHEHIDLVYFARADGQTPLGEAAWFDAGSWESLKLTAEVRTWCEAAVELIDHWAPPLTRVRT